MYGFEDLQIWERLNDSQWLYTISFSLFESHNNDDFENIIHVEQMPMALLSDKHLCITGTHHQLVMVLIDLIRGPRGDFESFNW